MERLATEGDCEAYREAKARFVGSVDGLANGEVISKIFNYMQHEYRNEYVYKSLMLKKIVYGRHSPKTTSALCELPIGGSVADFVLINGKAHVYEVKTDLDNLSRLENQLEDYYRAFRYVSVVCSERAQKQVSRFLADSPVGLMVLTDRLTFRTIREPQCESGRIDPYVQFNLLRKREREETIIQCGGYLPNVTPVRYYSACFEVFEQLDAEQRTTTFEVLLKKRRGNIDQLALTLYPDEFKLVAYNHGPSLQQGMNLQKFARSACK